MKLLGDGVMFHFPDPGGAVHCGLELVELVPKAELPHARVGVHAGPVVFRDGDYFGRTVNIAARIADRARRDEVIVSEEVRRRLPEDGEFAFEAIGPVSLKGVAEPVPLHRASSVV